MAYGDHEATDDPLQILRHSTAHLLAQAVQSPKSPAEAHTGPAIEPARLLLRLRLRQADLGCRPAGDRVSMRRLALATFLLSTRRPHDEAMRSSQAEAGYRLGLIATGRGRVSVCRTGDFLTCVSGRM
jgi:hypothetical protein